MPFEPGNVRGARRLAALRAGATGESLTAEQRHVLVEGSARAIDEHYVFEDKGARVAQALRDHAARGDFDGASAPADFARAVTADLRAMSSDLHMMLEYRANPGEQTEEDRRWAATSRRATRAPAESRRGTSSTATWAT